MDKNRKLIPNKTSQLRVAHAICCSNKFVIKGWVYLVIVFNRLECSYI